jgi:hypothetical protein
MDVAYQSETERWCARRKIDKSGYELVRNDSKDGTLISEDEQTIRDLPAARDQDDANDMLDLWRGRAAMHAALVAGGFISGGVRD